MMSMITTPVLAFSVHHYCRNRCNCIIALSLPVNGTITTVLSGSPVVLAARLMAWVQLQEPLRWRAASWGTKCNPTDERHGGTGRSTCGFKNKHHPSNKVIKKDFRCRLHPHHRLQTPLKGRRSESETLKRVQLCNGLSSSQEASRLIPGGQSSTQGGV